VEVLTRKQEGDGRVSNGYRIELLVPCHWVLRKNEPIRVAWATLAESYTLTECKREAEHMAAAAHLAGVRRLLWAELIVALASFGLVSRVVAPWDLVLFRCSWSLRHAPSGSWLPRMWHVRMSPSWICPSVAGRSKRIGYACGGPARDTLSSQLSMAAGLV
jgi:hypothetical protein